MIKEHNYTSVLLLIFIQLLKPFLDQGIHHMWGIPAEQAATGEHDPAVPVCC
jgi:hypothetical protein